MTGPPLTDNPRIPRDADADGNRYEWFTGAYDERTCAVCASLDGVTTRFAESAATIPGGAHRRCRCQWIRIDTEEWNRAVIGRRLSREAVGRK